MSDIITVKVKYCDKCAHSSYCYRPCPLALAALWDLPCEKEICDSCVNNEKENKDG